MLWAAHRPGAEFLRMFRDDTANLLEQGFFLFERHVLVIGRRALVARVDKLVEAVATIFLASRTDAPRIAVPRLFQLLEAVAVLAPFTLVVVNVPVDVIVVVAYYAAVARKVLGIVGDAS